MINVFLVINSFSGAQTYNDELVNYLVKKVGVSVFQIFLNCQDCKEFIIKKKDDTSLVFIPEKITKVYSKIYYKRAAQLLFCHFQYLKNIVVHANRTEHFYLVSELKSLFRCPVLFTLHFLSGIYSYYDSKTKEEIGNIKNVNVLDKSMYEFADHIICVTKFGKRTLNKCWNIELSKISVIYNGISLSNKPLEKFSSMKSRFGFSQRDKLILFAGQLEERKGIDKLIKAFLLIKEIFPSTKLIIAGEGDYNNYLPIAQDYIGRILFTGKLSKEVLNYFYRFSEIGIIPSQFEQCSYVALEMIKTKLPLIITNVPGLNEIIIHGKTGLVCKVKPNVNSPFLMVADEVDLALQIKKLIQDRAYAKKLARNSFRYTLHRYNIEKMGSETLKIYRMLVK